MHSYRTVVLLLLGYLPLSAQDATLEIAASPELLIAIQEGESPILLTAPHGGKEPLQGVEPRNGKGLIRQPGGFVTARDTYTEELARELARTS